jgi:FkbM family methyltransferase
MMFKEKGYLVFLRSIKYFLFKKITSKSTKLFVRGNDIISIGPLVNGTYEHHIVNFIDFCSAKYSNFFIDVGANIGLITCKVGNNFEKVICIEPNPICSAVLKANVKLSLHKNNFDIFECALGEGQNNNAELWIPKNNFGGAFIKDASNNLGEKILASKDGFLNFDKENYVIENVSIKSAEKFFDEAFQDLLISKKNNGVIKIDIEGMEHVVLSAVANSLPDKINTIIIFENWNEALDLNEIRSLFSKRKIKFEKIIQTPDHHQKFRLLYFINLLFSSYICRNIELNNTDKITGDIILYVN